MCRLLTSDAECAIRAESIAQLAPEARNLALPNLDVSVVLRQKRTAGGRTVAYDRDVFVRPESPLKRLPKQLDHVQSSYLVGLSVSADSIAFLYCQLHETLKRRSNLPNEDTSVSEAEAEPPDLTTPLVTASWALVDSMNRFRLLLDAMPRLKKSDWSELQVLLRTLKPVVKLRNPMQHLESELRKRAETESFTAVWGSLAWCRFANDGQVLTLAALPGPISQEGITIPMVNPVGREFRSEIDLITLHAYDQAVDLSLIYYAVVDFFPDFERSLDVALDEASEDDEPITLNLRRPT